MPNGFNQFSYLSEKLRHSGLRIQFEHWAWKFCRYNTDEDSILQIVEYVDDHNTIPLYSSVWSITENINGDIWVVDGNKYAVVVVDEHGRLLKVYKGQPNDQSFHPWGITHSIYLGPLQLQDPCSRQTRSFCSISVLALR